MGNYRLAQNYVVSYQGRRPHMEDTYVVRDDLVAIFDGHIHKDVANLAKTITEKAPPGTALPDLFAAIDEASRPLKGGACALAYRVDRAAQFLEVANAGDAELALVLRDLGPATAANVLTTIDRVETESERDRCIKAGARIQGVYVCDRMTGQGLMPTRTLGDWPYRNIGIISEPHIARTLIKPGDVVVAACDGLWDVLKASELPRLINDLDEPVTAELVAKSLALLALEERGSTDNLTIAVTVV